MEIPACWSCCVGLWVAVRPWSLATSYLALVAARIQGINLSLTPLPETNQIPWERWGVTQRMLLSSCPPSPITLVHQPPTFSSCVNAKTNTIPFYHWYPVLAYLKKTMWIVYLFATWTSESFKLGYILGRAPCNDSQQLINHTGGSGFSLLSLMIHGHCLYGFLEHYEAHYYV